MSEEEYPSEEFLKYVEEFDCLKDDVRILINRIEDEWWSAEWGFKRTTLPDIFKEMGIDDGVSNQLALELHTGGWSGNEDILLALKKNKWFYMFYWDMSRVGGHEYFRFTKFDSWEVGK